MTTKQTRSKTYSASQFSTLEPLVRAELISALEESTPVQEMELIEWLAAETPEDRSELEIPSVLERLTPSQQMRLFEWATAPMSEERGTDIHLRGADDVEEFNIQKWLEERE